MNTHKNIIVYCSIFFFLCGCAIISEPFKTVWGSSVRAIEKARKDAAVDSFPCSVQACFDSVLEILKEEEATVFIKDKKRNLIVAMDLSCCVDTTEVGIFFTPLSEGDAKTKVEVSAISAQAVTFLSAIIFSSLETIYPE
ncbi:hypothetical protein ACFL1E_02225 [Candidatus Omnitrophota bacterium]